MPKYDLDWDRLCPNFSKPEHADRYEGKSPPVLTERFAKVYSLLPAYHEQTQMQYFCKRLLMFVAQHGWWPSLSELREANKGKRKRQPAERDQTRSWSVSATKYYGWLGVEAGLLEIIDGEYYRPTALFWANLYLEPYVAPLPSDPIERVRHDRYIKDVRLEIRNLQRVLPPKR